MSLEKKQDLGTGDAVMLGFTGQLIKLYCTFEYYKFYKSHKETERASSAVLTWPKITRTNCGRLHTRGSETGLL